jgi:hypothetical protein
MCRIDLRCHLSKRLGVDLFARPCRSYPTRRWRGRYAGRDRRALTELLVDKIIIAPHPHKIDKAGRRHYTIRAIDKQFTPARLRPGYKVEQIDAFLDEAEQRLAAMRSDVVRRALKRYVARS